MKVTQKFMDSLKEEIESIEYGTVLIKINEKGKFIEISSEHRKRLMKDDDTLTSVDTSFEEYHRG